MSDERDRFLTESMGECWHEYDLGAPVLTCKGGGFVCRKCREFLVSNNDFSTEEDFERLWGWAHSRADLRSLLDRLSSRPAGPQTRVPRGTHAAGAGPLRVSYAAEVARL